MSGELEEPTLIQSAQKGELSAFNVLIDRYQDMLFRIALRMLGDEDSAADATQLAWISAYRKINEFRGGSFKTWVGRVVVNTCYDEIRRRHRRREVALVPVGAEGEESEAAYWLADPAPLVEDIVDSHEFDRLVNNCLQSLNPVYRAMLVLVDIEGLSYEEAAVAARVPMGTVRSRVARARLSMRKLLQESGGCPMTYQSYQFSVEERDRVRCA